MKELLKSIQVKIFITFFITVTLCFLTTRVNRSYGVIEGSGLIIFSFFISTIFYSLFLAQYDVKKVFISHFSRAIFRLILLSFLPVIMIIQGGGLNNLLLIYFNLTIFYFFFELFYNDLKNDSPFYIGKTANNDKIVRWINKSPFMMNNFPLWYISFKFILFVVSLVLLKLYWL